MCMFFVIFLKLSAESGLMVLYTNVKGMALKNISDWLHSYLHGREQRVVLNNTNSAFLPVKAGVP